MYIYHLKCDQATIHCKDTCVPSRISVVQKHKMESLKRSEMRQATIYRKDTRAFPARIFVLGKKQTNNVTDEMRQATI